MNQTFMYYSTRPMIYYHDPYHPHYWWWVLERDRRQRAYWAYHHRYTMDQARYQDMTARDPALAAEVANLEAQGLPRDPNFVPRDDSFWKQRRLLGGVLAAGPHGPLHTCIAFLLPAEPDVIDPDLMFTDSFAEASYNEVESGEASVPLPTSRWSAGFGSLCVFLPLGLIIVSALGLAYLRRQAPTK